VSATARCGGEGGGVASQRGAGLGGSLGAARGGVPWRGTELFMSSAWLQPRLRSSQSLDSSPKMRQMRQRTWLVQPRTAWPGSRQRKQDAASEAAEQAYQPHPPRYAVHLGGKAMHSLVGAWRMSAVELGAARGTSRGAAAELGAAWDGASAGEGEVCGRRRYRTASSRTQGFRGVGDVATLPTKL
jgi:hypothetical protein